VKIHHYPIISGVYIVHREAKTDNTNWRAGGPYFQMKNVNFRSSGGLLGRQKGGLYKKGSPAGFRKRRGGLQKGGAGCRKGHPASPP